MAEELLSLKWNNHQAHFVDILGFLREQEVFVDTTLACGGKLYPVHKFVLSTCSEYFKQMFTKNPAKHPIVFMKDVTSRDLEALLDFMYNGEVNVPQSSLGSLIKTAEGLQIKGLAVPDDPPTPKQKENINEPLREKRDSRHINTAYSPPPKRQRPKEIYSPPPSSNAPTIPQKSHSPSKVEELVVKVQPPDDEEDSRTSIHSGVSGQSENTNSVNTNVNNISNQFNSDRTLQNDRLNSSNDNEPSPGPSGMQPKDDEMTIKQEDVVDLGEDEEDWGRGDSEGYDSMGIKPDHNASSVFPEMLLHQDGGLPPSSDAAMGQSSESLGISQLPPSILGSDLPPLLPSAFQLSHIDGRAALENPAAEDQSRPYGCFFCPKKFKRKDHLKDHVKLHTGEKPYRCVWCGRGFIQKSNCKIHEFKCKGPIYTVHNIKSDSLWNDRQ